MNSKGSIHISVYLKKISALEKSVHLATGCMPAASTASLFCDYPLLLSWPSGKQMIKY